MRMTIVRHALAREKKSWPGPDLERPLDPTGERQAVGLASLLMKHKVRRIISSPAIRCVQTMQPLAEAANVPIELWDELGRDAETTRLMACFTDPAYRDAVLCTHGEVLHQLLLIDNVRRIAQPRPAVQTPSTDQRIGVALRDHDQRTSLQAQPRPADQVDDHRHERARGSGDSSRRHTRHSRHASGQRATASENDKPAGQVLAENPLRNSPTDPSPARE